MSQQQPDQSLNISGSILDSVQIGGIAGRDLNLTQIQGRVGVINVFDKVQVDRAAPIYEAKPVSQQEYRWRQVLLDRVKSFWIDGLLANSLHAQVLIELGLEERNQFVQNPLSEVEEFPSDSRRVFPVGTAATNIFDEIGAGRTLLVLGEPGSGKTITLLKLAETLVARTENDLRQPLPVVVNLSSWAQKRQSIANWLIQELYKIYGISKSLGEAWVEQEQLILLLDGLDEVDAKYQNDCIKALNQFIQEHGLTEMVVCSRIRDYESLSERLKLRSAIYVQPLTFQQIDLFLERAGESLSTLKIVLQNNAELQTFASSPLILSVMSLTYQGCSSEELTQTGTLEERRKRLFDNYIERMFVRRGTTKQYTKEQMLKWLTWLAQKMVRESQTVFLIERIQSSWLSCFRHKLMYRFGVVLIVSLIVSLALWLNDWLWKLLVPQGLVSTQTEKIFDAVVRLNSFTTHFGSIARITIALIAGLVIGLRQTIKPIETLKFSGAKAWSGMFNGFRKWSIVGLSSLTYIGLIAGSIAGLIIYTKTSMGMVLEIDELDKWSTIWQIAGIFSGLIVVTIIVVVARPGNRLTSWHSSQLSSRLRVALISGLIVVLVFVLDGFYISLAYLLLVLASGLGGAIIAGLSNGLSDRLIFRLVHTLIFSLILGLIAGLIVGLSTWLVGGVLLFNWKPSGGLLSWIKLWLAGGLGLGATSGLVTGLIARLREKTKPTITWQRAEEIQNWLVIELRKGLIVGVAFALILCLISSLFIGLYPIVIILMLSINLKLGLIFALGLSSVFGLSGGFIGIVHFGIWGAIIGAISDGLTGPNLELRTVPNQGIRNAAFNSIVFALVGGLICGPIWGIFNLLGGVLITKLAPTALDWLSFSSINIFIAGLFCSLIPGAACLQHFTLRFILWCNDYAPWNYARFLYYANDRHFMQKVGSGYIFIHRMLMEHFAQMEFEQKRS